MNSKLQIHELGNEAQYFQWMKTLKPKYDANVLWYDIDGIHTS